MSSLSRSGHTEHPFEVCPTESTGGYGPGEITARPPALAAAGPHPSERRSSELRDGFPLDWELKRIGGAGSSAFQGKRGCFGA